MKIILKKDVQGLGYKDDILVVKDGYGRNYLLPQRLAVLATDKAIKAVQEELKQRAPPNIVLGIAGNKIDLEEQRTVQRDTVEKYLKELVDGGCKEVVFRECSAKTGEGIHELFEEICQRLIRMAEGE